MSDKYISSSLGHLIPNVSGAYTSNPGFYGATPSEPYNVGSCGCGSDEYVVYQYRDSGSNRAQSYKNSTIHNGTFPTGNTGGSCGFYATENNGSIDVYYIWTNGSDIDGTTEVHVNQGDSYYPYGAILLGTYDDSILINPDEWEEPVDPGFDPSVSIGGENADIEPIYSEDLDFGFLDPYDPNAETTHNDAYFRCMQPYLLTGTEWVQFQDAFWYDTEGSTSFWHKLLDTVFGNVTDPLSAIAGLIRLPLPSGAIKTSGSGQMYLGGVAVANGTRMASAHYIGNRYTRISYGLRLKETFGTYFDYTHTAIELFLPYVNTVSLDVTEIMDSTMRITYIIDVYTGDLLCTLNCQKTVHGKNLNSIIGRWKGNCAMNEIFSRGNTQQHAQNLINGSMGVAGSILGGNIGGAVQGMFGLMKDQKVHTEKIGNCSGASGWMDIQVPYLIIKRDVPIYPENWRKIEGAEQNATFTVGDLSGYTEFEQIHVELTYVSDAEKKEIEGILKSGIIL